MRSRPWLKAAAFVLVFAAAIVAYEIWYPHHIDANRRLENADERRQWIDDCTTRADGDGTDEEIRRQCAAVYDDLIRH